ncbi:hypothetical protein KQI89_08755 [Clostridium sp. MSJ-4]|uniref:Chromosome segregation ATPase n=1 Tax=Clostridium simiarum TaxID=2841506 RepID=A0ABS6F027_9CLOT|nr:hypothetical protein [Clostridium simiarum]MBU5591854.1 hypothetical protein [Clostridium simiarum]
MPRITKFRIVGTKYDNFKKCHENTIFDLTKKGEPDHTLYTLENGSGKGVLMQLMSQIALPNTRWGKNDGNKITGMFLNKNNQFTPYTFHVILQWKLDTIPEKWLVTGICMTAMKSITKDDNKEEEKIGVKYFLYTHEHYANSFYTVENIPVYNEKERKPVSYDDFEKFLLENKRDFRRFSESATKSTNSDYYKYLEENGIYRSEWKILKLINRVEGGVGDYFSKAKDNKGIFDEYIIPVISENLNNQFEENKNALKDIFKSNISITKNLPILISREADYRNIVTLLEPLIEDAEIGISYGQRKSKSIVDGNNLYCTLGSLHNNIIIERDKWIWEEEKAKEIKKELVFQKDNLEYARNIRTKKEYEEEKLEEESRLTQIKCEIEELKEENKKYDINKIIIPMDQESRKRESKIEEKTMIIKSLNLEDVEETIKSIDNNIKEKWKFTEASWKATSVKYRAYESFLNVLAEKYKKEINDLNLKKQNIKINFGVFEEEKKNFSQKEKELENQFDSFRLVYPDLLLEEIENEKSNKYKGLIDLNKTIEELERTILELGLKNNKIELEKDGLNEKKTEFEGKYKEQKRAEEELLTRVLDVCKLEKIEEDYSHSWLQNRSFEIIKDKKIKKQRLNELRKELWETNMDLTLNNKEYWIPNNDIEIVKVKIEALGIKVIYGTQYLGSLNYEKRKEELILFPLLPFSLVITNYEEWDTVNKNISKDLFLHSIVPIYIRTEMKSIVPINCKFTDHKGLVFMENNEEFILWRENLSKRALELNENINVLENSIEKIDRLISDIEVMINIESSMVLEQKIKDLELDVTKLLEKLSINYSKTNNLKEGLNLNKVFRDKVKEEIELLEKQIVKLQSFVEFRNYIEEKERDIKKEEKNLNEIEVILIEKMQEQENVQDKKTLAHKNYETWKINRDNKLKEIREVIDKAEFNESNGEVYESGIEPSYSSLEEDSIYLDLGYRKRLSLEVEDKNYQIKMISERIDELQDSIDNKIKTLNKLDVDWKKYRIKGISLETLELEAEVLEKSLNSKNETHLKLEKSISKKDGLIVQIDKDINRQAKKINEEYNKAPQVWEDTDLEEKGFKLKEEIKGNDKYLKDVEDILKKLNNREFVMKGLLAELSPYEEIDPSKGKTSEYLIEKIKENEKNEVEQWKRGFKKIKDAIKTHTDKAQGNFEQFLEGLKTNIKDEILKHKIKEMIGDRIKIDNFSNNKDSFTSMKEHAKREISQVNNDKIKAERAREQWAYRAARQAIKIAESLKEMVNKMVYVNDNGYAFKLVRLKGEDLLPKEEDSIKLLLNEHFIDCIQKLEKAGVDFENLEDKLLEDYMSDKMIFSKALRGKYPDLEVYKMTEKNEFLYARPQNHHYSTWGAVNGGDGDAPEGSGGQTLSINTFMIMMLMNYRKKTTGNDNPWTVPMLDNPFGKASGAHVLDPVFKIANQLNFQIIAFAAPEIIKTEISERFPIFWALKINDGRENGRLGSLIGKVVHGGRVVD